MSRVRAWRNGGHHMDKAKIMVIDDEEDVVTFLTTLLEENGYTTCWRDTVTRCSIASLSVG